MYFGLTRYCPVCGSRLRCFLPAGLPRRPNARCPVCGCLERHRLAWLYFRDRTDLFDGRAKSFLHVAPEPQLARVLSRLRALDYVSADLDSPRAMVHMDITNLALPDESFDVVYCSHVFEHVPDDRKAMAEVFRILAQGGWAILQVPVLRERTIEDPSVVSPEERKRRFGQEDHVRIYGLDYEDRLKAVGFSVAVDPYAGTLDEAYVRRCGLPRHEDLHFCRKLSRTD